MMRRKISNLLIVMKGTSRRHIDFGNFLMHENRTKDIKILLV